MQQQIQEMKPDVFVRLTNQLTVVMLVMKS
jgi:hypothetical protein